MEIVCSQAWKSKTRSSPKRNNPKLKCTLVIFPKIPPQLLEMIILSKRNPLISILLHSNIKKKNLSSKKINHQKVNLPLKKRWVALNLAHSPLRPKKKKRRTVFLKKLKKNNLLKSQERSNLTNLVFLVVKKGLLLREIAVSICLEGKNRYKLLKRNQLRHKNLQKNKNNHLFLQQPEKEVQWTSQRSQKKLKGSKC